MRQAFADATIVEMSFLNRDSVTLRRQVAGEQAPNPRELEGHEVATLEAANFEELTLHPNENGEIVLFVSNTPVAQRLDESDDEKMEPNNFELFYALAKRTIPKSYRAIPELRWQGSKIDPDLLGESSDLFECEPYLTQLNNLSKVEPARTIPHHPQESIVSRYP